MTNKVMQIIEKFATRQQGGGGRKWYKPYSEDDKRNFKILWPYRKSWKAQELDVMIRFFGIGFIIVDEEGKELRRIP